jgi:hypothetical protein
MSLWTLAELDQLIDAMKTQMLENPSGVGSVQIGGRSISYNGFDDLQKRINFLARERAALLRGASGQSRAGYSLAKFS